MDAANPYARLGIDRSADARAVKKAYTALIRQFPPETHPEEFQAIRAAYETLSDPEARARYDAQQRDYAELSEAEARALATAEEEVRQGRPEDAIAVLEGVIERIPDAAEARSRLVALLLGGERGKTALAHAERLVALRPESASARVWLARALDLHDRPAEAREEMEAAVRLDPDDLPLRLLLASACRADRRAEEGEKVLDQAQSLAKDDLARLGILQARLSLRTPGGKETPPPSARPFHAAVAEALALMRGGGEDFARLATERLAVQVAAAFRAGQGDLANQLLAACARVRPDGPLPSHIPTQLSLGWEQLTPALDTWLRGRVRDGWSVVRRPWSPPTGVFPAVSVALLAVGLLLFRRAFGVFDLLLEGTLVILLGAAYVIGLQRWRELVPEGRPSLVVLHPLGLLQSSPERVDIWPWAHLTGIHVARTSARISVQLHFGATPVSVALIGEEAGKRFAEGVIGLHADLLGRMAAGALEALPLGDHVPLRAPPDEPEAAPQRWRPWGYVLLAAGAAVAIASVSTLQRSPLWDVAVADTLSAWEAYLGGHPDPADLAAAEARTATLRARGERQFAELVDPEAPAAAALLAAVGAVPTTGLVPVAARGVERTFREELRAAFAARGERVGVVFVDPDHIDGFAAVVSVAGGDGTAFLTIRVAGEVRYQERLPIAPSLTVAAAVSDALGLGRLPAVRRRDLLGAALNPYGGP